jgi:hypothetical protein
MKKYIGFFLLLSVLFTSCDEDLLDQFTPGSLTEEVAVQTSDDLSKLMNSSLAILAGASASEISFTSVFTDEVSIGIANGGQGIGDDFDFVVSSDGDSANGIWGNYYVALARINRVIKYADNIVAIDADDQLVIDRLRAEAYTLRAYAHTQLLSYFSTNPKDMNVLGVILSNDVFPTSYLAPRVTNGEVYALIDADIAAAEAFYAANPTPFNPSYSSKTFTTALKARVYALRGDYPNALIAANDVIDNSGLSLANFAKYLSVFHTDSNDAATEVIFKLERTSGQTKIGAIWASTNSTVTGSTFFEMGRSLFNELNTTNFASATNLQVTAISGNNITIPGHNLIVGDMFVSPVSVPIGATTSNGINTTPAGSLLKGKVYYVKSVSGNIITLTDAANGTSTILLTNASSTIAANVPLFPLTVKANYGDIRYSANVSPTSIIDYNYTSSPNPLASDRIAIRKYPGTLATTNLVNDIKISRLAEMYFIRAEALIAAGDLPGAAAAIKKVRDARTNRVQPLPVYATATDAWKDVLNERRIEFAYEGYRFIDLKRIGALAGVSITRDPLECSVNGCTLPLTDYRFALPIPTVESNPNPNILTQQNPGY